MHLDTRKPRFYIPERQKQCLINSIYQSSPVRACVRIQTESALDRELKQTFAAKKNRTFIVYHPAWSYLARDYGLVQVPIMEEEKEPGPKYLAGLIDMARENNISVIFVDPQFNPKSAEVIAREMNARIVVLDPLAEDYLQNMRHTGEEISKSLK